MSSQQPRRASRGRSSNTRPRAGRQPQSLVSRAPQPLIAVVLGIFGYLLWLHIHLIIRLNVGQQNSIVHLDDSPVPRMPPKTRAKAATTTTKAADNKDAIVKQLADALTQSFSAKDGIASEDRLGFEISLSDPKSNSTCRCDVISTDCLDAISCMPDLHSPQRRNALAWIGIELRRAIKATAVFQKHPKAWRHFPLGKSLQYHTIEAWRDWRNRNILPTSYNRRKKSIFVKEDLYPDCLRNNGRSAKVWYNGVSCFYQGPKDPEDSAGTIIEDEANRWYNATIESGADTERKIRKTMINFLRKHQPRRREEPGDATGYDAHFSSLGNLMLFAHIMRMMFNRRPFLDEIYQEKHASVITPGSENLSHNSDPFIVSLHMRRGDACGRPDPKYHQREASPLDSMAQTGGDRLCYRTEVYLKAVQRIRALVPGTRPLHVYIATDDVGNVIDEILSKKYTHLKNENNVIVDSILGVDEWHFLNYSRAHFNYEADSIESKDNDKHQPILGETAIADLWLLSHGHAMVGHLGSRFGKVSWLLATARRNNFIPFFTVDGHSFCCEIDESCGKTKPYITVENCLSFGHEHDGHQHENYFETGSLARKKVFLERQQEEQQ